jgi:hypothetical protein
LQRWDIDLNFKTMTIFINSTGNIVPQEKSNYKVELTGSFIYIPFEKTFRYEVKKITPDLPLKYIYSENVL